MQVQACSRSAHRAAAEPARAAASAGAPYGRSQDVSCAACRVRPCQACALARRWPARIASVAAGACTTSSNLRAGAIVAPLGRGRLWASLLPWIGHARAGRAFAARAPHRPACTACRDAAGPRAALAHMVTRGRRARQRLPLAALPPRRARGAHPPPCGLSSNGGQAAAGRSELRPCHRGGAARPPRRAADTPCTHWHQGHCRHVRQQSFVSSGVVLSVALPGSVASLVGLQHPKQARAGGRLGGARSQGQTAPPWWQGCHNTRRRCLCPPWASNQAAARR